MKNDISIFAMHKAVQAGCTPETEKTDMIPELAEAFAEILTGILSKPRLDNATTSQLLEELIARIDPSGKLDHRISKRYGEVGIEKEEK